MDYLSLIDKNRIPNHIAIIMDGNGRWAKEQGLDRVFGHKEGVNTVRSTVEICAKLGVKYLTMYAFSTENWNRPQYEVDALMELLVSALRAEVDALAKNNIRLNVIGDIASLPQKCQVQLSESIEILSKSTGLEMILALSYSSKWELTQVAKKIAAAAHSGAIAIEDINDEMVHSYLCTAAYPDPELMIRTGGEQRISNYLLYQLAYAELYFTEVHWPAFTQDEVLKAILDYQQRERRFGKTSEQIQNKG